MKDIRIEQVVGREILDSRGNPTVQADVLLSDGTLGRSAAGSKRHQCIALCIS